MVELEGFRDAMREDLEQRVESFGRETVELWVEITNEHLRNAPVGIGAPRSSEEWDLERIAESAEIKQEGGRWVAEWTATTDDGLNLMDIFEFGTEPHDIEGNPVLHWTDPETGEDVFAAKVEHPGIPAVAAVRLGKHRIEVAVEQGEVPGMEAFK